MGGHRRWVALIVASLVAVGAMGVVATHLQLSRDSHRPCGTPLRIDLRRPTILRSQATRLWSAADVTPPPADLAHLSRAEAQRQADEAWAEAGELEARCKDRQRLALLGIGAGGAAATGAVALSTYQLGRRRGHLDGRRATDREAA